MIELAKDEFGFPWKQNTLYALRVIGTDRFIQVGDYELLDMGSYTTYDGLILLDDPNGFYASDIMEIIEEECEIVEVDLQVKNVVRKLGDDE